MANYTTQANVLLTINGKQAQKMMATLEKDAQRLERGIARAAAAGDKATMKKLQRELNTTKRTMEQLKGTASSVDNVLRRLDKATPKELNRTLKTLQQQLNGIQRGTPAWDAHVAKIRAVKAELHKVNATIATQKSLWSQMNSWLNNAQTAIMALAAAVTGLIMAGRKAVKSYADMEETMANTVKYTRMTASEVAELNEIFKGMDTRLAREQLNLLAQEGGRLGYNTIASVREYVEAASIINVALVDLGEGATQTIAKLSNIFGMEQMYGVRDSMLKIGSTVNHLSQNCTAAKPFIVEFTQRMAGIGSTAKMTIPEIMAFAATLDAHGQKVEMSATALQRTIMELFKRPADMAKKVGLETNAFIETLNKSTTQGVMMFLEALGKLGEDKALAVLSPLFQDLGLDGARVSSVLSNLSSHLDFLKWQLGEAGQAFKEGSSASNEYAIFNNTVQASVDKARKRVSELAIELGEKLYPVMKHIYTSSGVFLRVLSQMVDFFIRNRREILLAVSALAAYNIVVAVYNARMGIAAKSTLLFNGAMKVLRGLLPPLRLLFAALVNSVQYFTNGLQVNYAMQLRWRTAMESMKFTSWIGLVMALAAAIYYLSTKTNEYTKKLREAINSTGNFSRELAKEMRQLDTLFGKLEACSKGTKAYKEVKDTIISQYGKYLNGLINEKNEIISLTAAYNRLAAAARMAAKERAIEGAKKAVQDTYDENLSELSKKLQESLIKAGKDYKDAVRITNRVIIDLQTSGTIGQDIVKELQGIKGSLADKWGWTVHPVNVVNKMISSTTEYNTALNQISEIEDTTNPLAGYTEQQLKQTLDYLKDAKKNGKTAKLITGINKTDPKTITLTPRQLDEYIAEAEARISANSSSGPDLVGGNPDFSMSDYTPYETEKERRQREQEARKAAAAAKRAEIKAKQEFKDKINDAKAEWEKDSTQNTSDYTAGEKSWTDFLLRKHQLEIKYYDDRLRIFEKYNLQEDEDYQELLKKKAEYEAEWLKKNAALKVEEAQRRQQAEEVQAQIDYNTPGNAIYGKEEALQQKLFEIRVSYLKQMRDAYNKDSEEYHSYMVKIEQAEDTERLRRQKLLSQKVAEWKKNYEYLEARKRYDLEEELLLDAYDKGLISYRDYLQAQRDLRKKYADEYMPESAKPQGGSAQQAISMKKEIAIVKSLYDQGIIDKKQYEEAKARIERTYNKKSIDAVRRFGSEHTNQLLDIYEAWQNFFNNTEEDGGNWATRLASLASSVFAVMNAGMQQFSEFTQACADIEVAKTEKKYDREIELAEGNSYRVKKAEKDKEKAIAKIKSDASKKQYAMQVIQAVAQTATNALNAYGSAAAVPVIGYILAPIAAAMAVAAGAMQIATIKKQQQASEAQGYQSGGFTPEGKPDEVAGVVHKGEWVASQRLVNNPRTRPLLEALDYAQRNNTIGSITHADVSRTIMAPAVIAARQSDPPAIVNNTFNNVSSPDNEELTDTIRTLKKRLDEPFVTINTVSGDHGIRKAQEDYDRLMRNKSPKSRK